MKENSSNIIAYGIVKAVIILVFLAGFVWLFRRLYPVFVYLILAFLVALLGQPLKRFFMRKLKFTSTWSAITVLFLFAMIFFGILSLLIPLISEQATHLSALNTDAFREKISYSIEAIRSYLESKNIQIPDHFSFTELIKNINLSFIPELLQSILGLIGQAGIGAMAVLFISFFLLKEEHLLSNALFRLIPDDNRSRYMQIIEKIKSLLINYLSGVLLQISILFILYSIGLHIIGIENATIIAFMGALLNIIPYVGPLVGWILMLILGFTSQLSTGDFGQAIHALGYITLLYLIAQLIDNFVVQPFVYSRSVKSHPLEIFLVIMSAGYLFGIIGMMIAVPAYTILKILIREFYTEYKDLFFKI